jgi:hypothetical protein
MNHLIPPLDSFGIPAPAWIFVFLMNLTLALHFICVGYVATAALIQIFLAALAAPGSDAEWMLRRTEGPLPVALSFLITLGVAPLLFVQVLYQPFFYTANILIAYQWFGIFLVVMLGFYVIYALNKGEFLGRKIPRACDVAGRILIFGCVLYAMATHTINAIIVLHPEKWRAVQAAGGNFMALDEPVLWPRLAHNFLALLVIGSVWLMALGGRSIKTGKSGRDVQGGKALAKLGGLLGAMTLFLQMFAGLWLLLAESPEARGALFTGRPAAILWMASLATALVLLILLVMALAMPASRGLLYAAWGVLTLTLGGMFAGRELVRQVRLGAHGFSLDQWPVHWQISSLILFLVLFVVALAVVGLMLRWSYQAMTAPARAED